MKSLAVTLPIAAKVGWNRLQLAGAVAVVPSRKARRHGFTQKLRRGAYEKTAAGDVDDGQRHAGHERRYFRRTH